MGQCVGAQPEIAFHRPARTGTECGFDLRHRIGPALQRRRIEELELSAKRGIKERIQPDSFELPRQEIPVQKRIPERIVTQNRRTVEIPYRFFRVVLQQRVEKAIMIQGNICPYPQQFRNRGFGTADRIAGEVAPDNPIGVFVEKPVRRPKLFRPLGEERRKILQRQQHHAGGIIRRGKSIR